MNKLKKAMTGLFCSLGLVSSVWAGTAVSVNYTLQLDNGGAAYKKVGSNTDPISEKDLADMGIAYADGIWKFDGVEFTTTAMNGLSVTNETEIEIVNDSYIKTTGTSTAAGARYCGISTSKNMTIRSANKRKLTVAIENCDVQSMVISGSGAVLTFDNISLDLSASANTNGVSASMGLQSTYGIQAKSLAVIDSEITVAAADCTPPVVKSGMYFSYGISVAYLPRFENSKLTVKSGKVADDDGTEDQDNSQSIALMVGENGIRLEGDCSLDLETGFSKGTPSDDKLQNFTAFTQNAEGATPAIVCDWPTQLRAIKDADGNELAWPSPSKVYTSSGKPTKTLKASSALLPTEKIAFEVVSAPEHSTVAIYTNKVIDAKYEVEGDYVWSNRFAKVVYTVDEDKDWYFKGEEAWSKAITNLLDTTVDPAVLTNDVPEEVVEVTCERKGLKFGDSTNLVEGVYTAMPTTYNGCVFYVDTGATLTGTNVTFASNETTNFGHGAIFNGGTVALKGSAFTSNKTEEKNGGAIYNNGIVSLDDVTFEANEAKSVGGAIHNGIGTVNFDGPVTLVTKTDTISNGSDGTLNWNLVDGKHGVLNGYDKLNNDGKLLLTVKDYEVAAGEQKDIVIATGDFDDVSGKDTFSVTNATVGGEAIEIKINGNAVSDGKQGYRLAVNEEGNLVLSAWKITCEVIKLGSGQPIMQTNLVDCILTAKPANSGSCVYLMKSGKVFAENTRFANNEATGYGGAISVAAGSEVNLSEVVFSGNVAKRGGAIYIASGQDNLGIVNLNGKVTLATDSDTIANGGVLNWNLADGNTGFLDGYHNVTNTKSISVLQITVDDEIVAPTNIVIATGDYSDLTGKDTFIVTNVDAAASCKIEVDGSVAGIDGVGYRLVREEVDDETTCLVLQVVVPSDRVVVKGGTEFSTNGIVWTSLATSEYGGALYVDEDGTANVARVTFLYNEADRGGAIYNNGVLNVQDVEFSGNSASEGGAICNAYNGVLNLRGQVTLETASDDISWNAGIINWDLTGEKTGCLNGYQWLENDGYMTLTVSTNQAPTSFVIGTGDFSEVMEYNLMFEFKEAETGKTIKDGFAAGATIKVGEDWWSLSIVEDKLILTKHAIVALTNTMNIGTGGETNAYAKAAVVNGVVCYPDNDGNFKLPAGLEVKVDYYPGDRENLMFGPGLNFLCVSLGQLTGDTDMATTGLIPTAEPRWLDAGEEREIALDTRDRIVVENINDFLAVAYSTNNWGALKYTDRVSVTIDGPNEVKLPVNAQKKNDYLNLVSYIDSGDYGAYHISQAWICGSITHGSTNVTVYYSQPYKLTTAVEGDGEIEISAEEIDGGYKALGYEFVKVSAVPQSGRAFRGWKLEVDGADMTAEAFAAAGSDPMQAEARFEMPKFNAKLTATFTRGVGVFVDGVDIVNGKGDGWWYEAAKRTLHLNTDYGGGASQVTLSGCALAGVKVRVAGKEHFDQIILSNFTNDLSQAIGGDEVALEVSLGTNVKIEGANYLASGPGKSAIVVPSKNSKVEFDSIGEGASLTLVPGAAKEILPGIGGNPVGVKIKGGTYSSTVDPEFAYDEENNRKAFSNGDGTWTVKPYVVVTFEYQPDFVYTVVTNAKNECVAKPANPKHLTRPTYAFNYWSKPGQGTPWDFNTPIATDMTLRANYELAQAAYVDENGATNIAPNVASAITNAPAGGTVASEEKIEVEDVDKPIVIVGDKNQGVDVTSAEDSGFVVAVSTNEVDGTVIAAVGTNVNDVVIAEKPVTKPTIPVVEKPAEANQDAWDITTNAIATAQSPNVKDIVDSKVIEGVAEIAKENEADAVVSEVKLVVEAKSVATNVEEQVSNFTIDVYPVMTVYGIKDGTMTNVLAETSEFDLSGESVKITLDVSGFDRVPMLISHVHGDKTEYIFHPAIAKEGEPTFVYDAVAKTLSFEMAEFSAVEVSFEEPQQVAVTLDANGGYFGIDVSVTNRVVYEVLKVKGLGVSVYRHLTAENIPANTNDYTFLGWYYQQPDGKLTYPAVQNYDPLASEVAHRLVALWDIPTPRPTLYSVKFDVQGHGEAPETQLVREGDRAVRPEDPVAEGYEFGGWFRDKNCLLEYDFNSLVIHDITLYAAWTEIPQPVVQGITFETSEVEIEEGESVAVSVKGGATDRPTAVTLSLVKGTYGNVTAYVDGKKAKFPLTLNWSAGEVASKVVTIATKAATRVASDKFFMLQLGSPAGAEIGEIGTMSVVVRDMVQPAPEADAYVQALAWPVNGGKVTGYGALKSNAAGEVTSTRTLKATANKWAEFDGWYAAKADDPTSIDLSKKLTSERSLKVGNGTKYGSGTYFAYFTDVTAVAAVNSPEIESAMGVTVDGGAYVGIVGVKFSLPVSFDDETAHGSMSITGLPSGLKYDKSAGAIVGVPTKACEKTVKFVAKNAAGKHTTTFEFVIKAMPEKAIGTWDGMVRAADDADDGTHAGFGTVQFTAGKTGSLTAKVMTRLTGTKSFSAKGYVLIDENTFGVAMENKSGERLIATLSLTNEWNEAQLVGAVAGGKFEDNGEECTFRAIRNAFDQKAGESEAILMLQEYKGTYSETLRLANGGESVGVVGFRVQDGGKVLVKAAAKNGTYSATCAGAFRITPNKLGAIQTAVRNGKCLWATDSLVNSKSDSVTGLACEYDANGKDTHEVVGTILK